jgi:hypothetical protein
LPGGSRGLGDVYKRQLLRLGLSWCFVAAETTQAGHDKNAILKTGTGTSGKETMAWRYFIF